MKHREEIMQILEAFDLTRSFRDAGELAGCSPNTVAHWVARRDAGELTAAPARRPQLIDEFLPKLEEWMEASHGKVRADVCHDKLSAMGYTGSERTTRRAVATTRRAWLAGNRRVHRPWVPEPGLWFQWDFGDGPSVAGVKAVLFCAWLSWSRFRVVLPIKDKSLPTVLACIDSTLRRFGGCPTYALTDNEKTVTVDHVARIAIRNPPVRTSLTPPTPQRRVETWCRERAGLRVHGTTQQRPVEVFSAEEQPRLGPAPTELYDVPIYATAKVHRDHHIEVARSLYSIPGALIGARVEVRADRTLVRVFHRGQLIKVHPRQQPGHRSTDPDDLPSNKTVYAMRDLDRLRAMAAEHGPAIGAYASAVLDIPLPWTKMRQVYALLGLVKKWGAKRVNTACGSALEHEQVNVGLIGRMLERGTEKTATAQPSLPGMVVAGRFARDPDHFATRAKGGAR